MKKSRIFIATPPGYTIKEQLDDRGLTQKEFALRMETSEKHISRLINGEVELTTDMAIRLEMVLGIPSSFWCNLEAIYREKLIKILNEKKAIEEEEMLNKFPYSQMEKYNWVPKTKNKNEKIINLRKFFEVNRLRLLDENHAINILCRRVDKTELSDYSLMAWSQKAKIESREINTLPINIKGIKNAIPELRKLTLTEPEVFTNELRETLSKNGVAIIFLPCIGGSFLHGATFYSGNKIVVSLTTRGKDADKFWFSFFHELGHILLGHINKEYDKNMEEEADLFAKNILIPNDRFDEYTRIHDFSRNSVISFAKEVEIDPGIVVGRLQKEKYIPYSSLNGLKRQYTIN